MILRLIDLFKLIKFFTIYLRLNLFKKTVYLFLLFFGSFLVHQTLKNREVLAYIESNLIRKAGII